MKRTKTIKKGLALLLSSLILLSCLACLAYADGWSPQWFAIAPDESETTPANRLFINYNSSEEIEKFYWEKEQVLRDCKKIELKFKENPDHFGLLDNLDNYKFRDLDYQVRLTPQDGAATVYSKDEYPILGIISLKRIFEEGWLAVCMSPDDQYYTGVYFDTEAYKADLAAKYSAGGLTDAQASEKAAQVCDYVFSLNGVNGNNLFIEYNRKTQEVFISWEIQDAYDPDHPYLMAQWAFFPRYGENGQNTLLKYIRYDESYFDYEKPDYYENLYNETHGSSSGGMFGWLTNLWQKILAFFRSLFG